MPPSGGGGGGGSRQWPRQCSRYKIELISVDNVLLQSIGREIRSGEGGGMQLSRILSRIVARTKQTIAIGYKHFNSWLLALTSNSPHVRCSSRDKVRHKVFDPRSTLVSRHRRHAMNSMRVSIYLSVTHDFKMAKSLILSVVVLSVLALGSSTHVKFEDCGEYTDKTCCHAFVTIM